MGNYLEKRSNQIHAVLISFVLIQFWFCPNFVQVKSQFSPIFSPGLDQFYSSGLCLINIIFSPGLNSIQTGFVLVQFRFRSFVILVEAAFSLGLDLNYTVFYPGFVLVQTWFRSSFCSSGLYQIQTIFSPGFDLAQTLMMQKFNL